MKSRVRDVVAEAEPFLREILDAQIASDTADEVAASTRVPIPVFARWYSGDIGRRVTAEPLVLNACFVEPRAGRICVFDYPQTDVLSVVDCRLSGDLVSEIPHIGFMTVVDAQFKTRMTPERIVELSEKQSLSERGCDMPVELCEVDGV